MARKFLLPERLLTMSWCSTCTCQKRWWRRNSECASRLSKSCADSTASSDGRIGLCTSTPRVVIGHKCNRILPQSSAPTGASCAAQHGSLAASCAACATRLHQSTRNRASPPDTRRPAKRRWRRCPYALNHHGIPAPHARPCCTPRPPAPTPPH